MKTLTTPHPDQVGVRLHHEDFHQVLNDVAGCLNVGEAAVIQFAAEGSQIPIILVPRESFAVARSGRWAISNTIDGNMPGAIYVVRGAEGDRCRAVWKGGAHWDLMAVREWLCPNMVDALPLYLLLNELEIARGRLVREEFVRRDYEASIRAVMRHRFGLGHDTLPPAWLDTYGTDEPVDMAAVIRGWFE